MLTPDQIAARRSSIGSSDVAAVLGLSEHRGPHDVWAEKVGESEPFEGNEFTEFGNRLEPVLIRWYADRNLGLCVLPNNDMATGEQRVYHRDGWMSATPDAIANHRDSDGRLLRRIVEAKTANWRQSDKWGEPGTDEIPADYLCQVMWQMAVMNIDRADIVVLLDREFRIYTVNRRMDLEEAMIAKAREFWGYVERREMPPIDGSEACFHALARRNKGGEYLTETFDPEAGEGGLTSLYRHLAKMRKEMARLKADEAETKASIMSLVGPDHRGFKCDMGSIFWVEKKGTITTDWKSLAIAKGATKEEIDAATTTGAPVKYTQVRLKGEKA